MGNKCREPSEDKQPGTTSQSDWGTNELGDIRRAGHHEPDWETNVGRQVKTSSRAPLASKTGRQMNLGNKCRETSEDKQPGTTSQSDWETNELGDIRGAGHYEPDWETNVGRQVKTNSRAPPASQTHIHLRFAWQAWHLWHWAGSGGTVWRAWARLVAGDAAQLCVAGVALGDIYLRFAWQAWHLWHRAGSGGALGRAWSPVTPLNAWHLATRIFVSRGKRGTWRHLSSFCVASVALGDIYLGLAWQAWRLVTACDSHLRFARQAWPFVTSTFVLRGRRGTCGTGLALVARLGALGLPVTALNFAWQEWHLATSTIVSRDRRGTW